MSESKAIEEGALPPDYMAALGDYSEDEYGEYEYEEEFEAAEGEEEA